MERKIIVIVENERLFSGDVDRYNFYRWLAGGLGRFSEYAETYMEYLNL